MAKRSEISAHIVWGANRKPYAASSNPSLLLTSVDLETYNSRSSIFGNNDKWRVVAKRSEIGAHIVWGANEKPYAASSTPSQLTLKLIFHGHPFSETTINGVLWPNAQR